MYDNITWFLRDKSEMPARVSRSESCLPFSLNWCDG